VPTYKYTAMRPTGEVVAGRVKAKNAGAARVDLSSQLLRTTGLQEQKSWTSFEITKSRIKPKELMYISRQLSAYVEAGIPILDAISDIANESDSRSVRRTLTEISDDLRSGSTLLAAFERHPHDFPGFYLGILGAAELTGELDKILLQLSEYIERDVEARRKLRSALTYPAIVLVMAVLTVVVLTVYVLPKFAEVFSTLGGELPLPTRMLIGISNFITQWWWAILLCIVAIAVSGFIVTRFRGGRKFRDQIMIRIPLIGIVVRYAMIERFLRILASTTKAGVPIPEAMRVATNAVTNLVYHDALVRVREQMVMGEGIAAPIEQTELFPGMATQMFRVGERTGNMDEQLEVAANFYSRELGYKVDRLATMVEPIITIGMGLGIGFVAVALVSAMFGIYSAPGLDVQ